MRSAVFTDDEMRSSVFEIEQMKQGGHAVFTADETKKADAAQREAASAAKKMQSPDEKSPAGFM